jgi:hypothetical protein
MNMALQRMRKNSREGGAVMGWAHLDLKETINKNKYSEASVARGMSRCISEDRVQRGRGGGGAQSFR